MKIEEAIKQKNFESSFHKAMINLIYTHSWITNKTSETFKEIGITPQQYNVLRILKGKFPKVSTAGEIKEVMLDKTPDLTRLLDRLLEKEYITRTICGDNRRKIDVLITDKGLNLLEKSYPKVKSNQQLLNKLTEQEAEQLSNLLDKIRS
jgi:DNA-binding MarR family transcriptional regulator